MIDFKTLKESIQDNSFNGDYGKAIEYYQNQKNMFLIQLQSAAKEKQAQREIEENLQKTLTQIVDTAQVSKELLKQTQLLLSKAYSKNKKIQTNVKGAGFTEESPVWENWDTARYQRQIKKAYEKVKSKTIEKYFNMSTVNDTDKISITLNPNTIIKELNSLSSTPSLELPIITNFLTNFSYRTLVWLSQGKSRKAGTLYVSDRTAASLAGYIKEDLVGQALNRYSKNFNDVIVLNVGSENKQGGGDIRFSFPVKEMIMNYQKDFDISVKLATNIDNIKPTQYSEGLEKFQSIYSKDETTRNSWIRGVEFLAQFQHIIQVLGPQTVGYNYGNNFQFTDDFIETFRGAKLYLAFQKKQNILTSQIALQKYTDKKN